MNIPNSFVITKNLNGELYMNNIEKQLYKYDFFNDKIFKIYSIQDYGRKSKYKIEINNKYYTLILTSSRINPYINKFKYLGDDFKKIIGFKYLSYDNSVLLLDFFGNNKGIDLIKIDNKIKDEELDNYCEKLKSIIDNIHSNKVDYIDFSNNNYKNWKEYYIDEISQKIYSIYNQKLIDNKLYEKLINILETSSKVYNNFQTNFIHADITPLNVCINLEDKDIYLIDYDDFKIGDSLMDISRIINCKNMSKIFKKLVDKYYVDYENNINHLFYTLRVNINWYNHIVNKKQEDIYDLEKAKNDIFDIIEKIIN